MKRFLILILVPATLLTGVTASQAQKAPEAGYAFPAGGKAGTTVDVHLGGYDWTPDMEFFMVDRRVSLTPSGSLGPILIPPPPYWFGAKGRIAALPLPREIPAKFVLPADLPAGPIFWQAANANGATSAGIFIVGTGLEVVEDEHRKGVQTLSSLPVAVSGRLIKNEEIDRYRFTATRDGPITCDLMARRLGAKFLGVLQVRDGKGATVADLAGTGGIDPTVTFAAKKGREYVVSVHDVDFAGDRSFVYRLTITDGPRILGTLPAAGQVGTTRAVEFVGLGVATGSAKLESVTRQVAFPAAGSSFDYRLETPFGTSPAFRFPLSDLTETVASAAAPEKGSPVPAEPSLLTTPSAVTGVLDQPEGIDRYTCNWKKGQVWSLSLEARRIGSPLDVVLAVRGPDGKELARNDDLPETTDAGLEFTVPADGSYQIVVSDVAGKSGSRAAIYRLAVRQPASDFALQLAVQRTRIALGGKFDLTVQALRKGGFQGPIQLKVQGLPAGVSVPDNLTIAAGKPSVVIPLQVAADAGTTAGHVTVIGSADLKDGPTITRTALAPIATNLAPSRPEENRLPAFFLACTLKPLFKGQPVDQDTGRKVHRGSTFPAEVILERMDGFQGEVVLQMAGTQSYQVQGITGGEVKVPGDVKRTIYPCYMPEWLESTRTSRMGMIGVAKVADPKGKIRYLTGEISGFITMTMEGALLKIAPWEGGGDPDMTVPAGRAFDVQLKVSRLSKLTDPARLELRVPEELAGKLKAEPIVVAAGQEKVAFRVTPTADLQGLHSFSIRATALQDGVYPAISEAAISIEFVPASPKAP